MAIRTGNYVNTAARFAGVSPHAYTTWLKYGKKRIEELEAAEANGDPYPFNPEADAYKRFYEDVEKAEAESEVSIVARLRQAAENDWKAGAWLLEHRWRRRYGRQQVEVTGADGAPIAPPSVTVNFLSAPQTGGAALDMPSENKALAERNAETIEAEASIVSG
jgi:hypothetical protein